MIAASARSSTSSLPARIPAIVGDAGIVGATPTRWWVDPSCLVTRMPVKVVVQATDASGTAAKASGLDHVRISFGDGSRPIAGVRAIHRYGHSGKVTVRISAVDKAGNVAVKTRRITIHK